MVSHARVGGRVRHGHQFPPPPRELVGGDAETGEAMSTGHARDAWRVPVPLHDEQVALGFIESIAGPAGPQGGSEHLCGREGHLGRLFQVAKGVAQPQQSELPSRR